MNWDDHEIFCLVAKHGSFTAAAKAMGRPKSSVSATVIRLEERLGIRLLERTTRSMRLTKSGENLYNRVEPLFQGLREAHDLALVERAEIEGTLRIATPYEFGAHHLSPKMCKLMKRYPKLDVEIHVEHSLLNPFEAPYDLVFSMTDQILPSSSVIARRVFTLHRGLFAAPKLLNVMGTPKKPSDLVEFPVLATPTDNLWKFEGKNGGRDEVSIANVRMRSSSAEIRYQAACTGLGIVQITKTYCEDAVASGALSVVLPDFQCEPLTVYAQFTERKFMVPKVRAVLDCFGS